MLESPCSEVSVLEREPLIGTAIEADVWILLEYAAPWSAQAEQHNTLPPAARAWIKREMDAVVMAGLKPRLQFIKQTARRRSSIVLILARTAELDTAFLRRDLHDYEALEELSVMDLLEKAPPAGDEQHALLVCTNGKRDACCARLGWPLYKWLSRKFDGPVWQTNHLGGHRFAPTLVSLPLGACYGRVDAADAPALLEALSRKELFLDGLRGRSCYPGPAQAADYYLRRSTGRREIEAIRLTRMEDEANGLWTICFTDTAEANGWQITLQEEKLLSRLSCGAAPESRVHYRLLDQQRLSR